MLTYWEKHLQAVRSEFKTYLSAGSRLSSLGCVLPEQRLSIQIKWLLEILFHSTLFVIIYQKAVNKSNYISCYFTFICAVLIFLLNINSQFIKNTNMRAWKVDGVRLVWCIWVYFGLELKAGTRSVDSEEFSPWSSMCWADGHSTLSKFWGRNDIFII